MQSNIFRTTISISKPNFQIDYPHKILSIGSCFSENMAKILALNKFNILSNPFGISYNAMSIAKQLKELTEKKTYAEHDLFFHLEQWHSFQHHGSFSGHEKETVLENINSKITKASKQLEDAAVLIITLGTAYAYVNKEQNEVVNNCHKMPQTNFKHELIDANTITEQLHDVLSKLGCKIILSVSPVRHTNLSATENNISKAHLLMACQALQKQLANVYYFPAYELMLDDLRDYRFYAKDMIHPNEVAIEYIWEHFKNTCIHKNSYSVMAQVEQVQNAIHHRPRNNTSEAYKIFLQKHLQLIESITLQERSIDLNNERDFFEQQINAIK
jgi:hypothetical protein